MNRSDITTETAKVQPVSKPRKANECIKSLKNPGLPEMLFDEFWREGELALLFGPHGIGKSMLATQLAEEIARGRGVNGFRMPSRGRKVLYVNFKSTDAQFFRRYLRDSVRKTRFYKFSENLHFHRPAANDDLLKWLTDQVKENRFSVVVIDDLSMFRKAHDGTRETLPLMLGLKRIKDELGISIMVLVGSEQPAGHRPLGEIDLRRSRILCDAADSVIAIGPHSRVGKIRLMQTRSQAGPIVWSADEAPMGSIVRQDAGFLE